MSLNKALGELFKVIREEAAANPEFALKLEQAMAVYKPSKRAKQAAREKIAPRPAPAKPEAAETPEAELFDPPAAPVKPDMVAPALNPVAMLGKEGEEALRAELEEGPYSAASLAALAAEHNLDPLGLADPADKQSLVDQIVAQAKKRVQRDAKLFDY